MAFRDALHFIDSVCMFNNICIYIYKHIYFYWKVKKMVHWTPTYSMLFYGMRTESWGKFTFPLKVSQNGNV